MATLIGDNGNNTLTGTLGDDSILGLDGDDSLSGGDSTSIASSGAGNDTLDGGPGNDTLHGGVTQDRLAGGLGDDVYIFDGDFGVASENPNEGTDTINTPTGFYTLAANFENLNYTGNANFTGSGNVANNQIAGGPGNDTLFGDVGDDTLSGGAGNDSLMGSFGNNSLSGGSGQDTISKNGGSDFTDGGDGNDLFLNVSATGLVNGVFPDPTTFTGGAGTDTFRLSINLAGPITPDVITDFQTGSGGDIIGLSTSGLIGYPFGTSPFTSGHYRLVQDNADTLLQADKDGPQSAFDWITVLVLKNTLATSFVGFNFEAPLDFNPNGPTVANLTGDSGDNALFGGAQDDVLFGGDGNDTLSGSGGNDFLSGDDGNDSLIGGNGNDTLDGGAGNDTLSDNSGNDSLLGGTGNDSLSAGSSSDTLGGGSGDDSFAIGLSSFIDVIDGGAGTDLLTADYHNGFSTVSTTVTLDGITNSGTAVHGLDQATFAGVERFDITTDRGNSNINIASATAASRVTGSLGNDTISTGSGNDTIDGGQGANVLNGGAGDDLFLGVSFTQDAVDTITGGAGHDTFSFADNGNFLHGTDIITDFQTGPGGDVVDLTNLLLLASPGTNPFASNIYHIVQSGSDALLQGSFNFLIFKNTDAASFTRDNFFPLVNPWGHTGLLFTGDAGANNLSGTWDYDTLLGNGGNDTLQASYGDDSLSGGDGDDSLLAQDGNDIVSGGTGYDYLSGASGTDTLSGNEGDDTLDGGDGSDSLSGGDGNDLLLAGPTYSPGGPGPYNDILLGGAGNDTLIGGDSANERLDAGDGNDSLSSGETMFGGAGADTIALDGRSESIDGGDGDDLFLDVAADDQGENITGGAGSDRYVLTSASFSYPTHYDRITDFQPGPGGDIIDLNQILSQLIGYIPGTNPIAGGFVRLVQDTWVTRLEIDKDGPGGAFDFALVLDLGNVQVGSITDDNFAPVFNSPLPSAVGISALSADKDEGDTGTTPFTFLVTRSGNVSGSASVDWNIAPFHFPFADASDFSGPTSGTLTWAPGDAGAKTITLNVIGDNITEGGNFDEEFAVNLSNAAGATISTDSANGKIREDDVPPTVDIQPLSADNAEGNSGTTPFTFTVTRTGDLTFNSSVSWALGFNYIPVADAGDFSGPTSGTLSWASGDATAKTITVNVLGDNIYESGGVSENFLVYLQGPSGARIGTSYALATIRDDDHLPTVSISALSANNPEGSGGTTPFTFQVSRTGDGSIASSVHWGVVLAGSPAADASDFSGPLNGDISFAANDSNSQTITVNVIGDRAFESGGLAEHFTVTLSNAFGATIDNVHGVATGSIQNDDISYPHHDFNADRMSDILWRNDSGAVSVWEMNGTSLQYGKVIPGAEAIPQSWQIAGTGDFNADGMSDILWRNDNSGAVSVWEMNGTSLQYGKVIPGAEAIPPSWHVAGTGDFNADGMSDILWRNDSGGVAIWEMNGASLQYGKVIPGAEAIPQSWQIAGTGDFNADGMSDILWRNDDSGAVSVWEMNGTSLQYGKVIPGAEAIPQGWQIAGTGDFNADGMSDILWRNDSGTVSVWEMNGTSLQYGKVIPGAEAIPPSWHVAGTGDFNADGMSDILWRNDSGAVAVWEMNGTSLLYGAVVPGAEAISQSWHIQDDGLLLSR